MTTTVRSRTHDGNQKKKKRISECTVDLARAEVRGKMRRITKLVDAMEFNRELSEAIRRDAELGPELCLLGRQLGFAAGTPLPGACPVTAEESGWVRWFETLADDIIPSAKEANDMLVYLHRSFLILQRRDDPRVHTIIPGKEVDRLRQRHQQANDYFYGHDFFSTGLLKEDNDVDATDRGVGGSSHSTTTAHSDEDAHKAAATTATNAAA